jgi:hypothetical protein
VFTVAVVVLLLLHTPPLTLADSVVVAASHTWEAPLVVPAFGNGLIVIAAVVYIVPQPLVTV